MYRRYIIRRRFRQIGLYAAQQVWLPVDAEHIMSRAVTVKAVTAICRITTVYRFRLSAGIKERKSQSSPGSGIVPEVRQMGIRLFFHSIGNFS